MNILEKTVSYYPSVSQTTAGVSVSLHTLLTTNKHKERIIALRNSDKEVKANLKKELPCYTVGGVFKGRGIEGLVQYSGLAVVDLDKAEEYDTIALLSELKKVDCIAYAGHSCSGNRLFCIIPFKYGPDLYSRQYDALTRSFSDMGLPMGDECHKTISQPRFVSWNSVVTQFFNYQAREYDVLPPEKTMHIPPKKRSIPNQNPFALSTQILEKQGNYFPDGNKHQYIRNLCRRLNKMGVSKTEVEAYIGANLMPLGQIKSNCITYTFQRYTSEFNTWTMDATTPKYEPNPPQLQAMATKNPAVNKLIDDLDLVFDRVKG